MIEFKNVTVQYDKVVALKDASFKINKGDFVYIVGPNGSGKTTTVKVLSGLLKPSHGQIILSEQLMGYLPQKMNTGSGFPITVKEVIYSGFVKQRLKMSKEEKDLIQSWLVKMGIPNVMYKQISELSGGEQQRVYLIRALISNPDTLILDEPTSALDPVFRGKFFESLKNFYNDGEKTIIYVTHELELLNGVKSKTLFVDQKVEYYEDSHYYMERVRGHKHV